MSTWITLGVIVIVVLWSFWTYNSLIALRNGVKNAFAQIDVQLQRRYDLIPNLVETAKTYLQHERTTLEAVIEARNMAQAAAHKAGGDPTNAEAIRSLSGAEGMLGAAMTRFFALAEAYPDLKANQTMQQLTEELSSTENRVAFSRQAYNDSVMSYNNQRESAPANIVAGMFGFKEAQMLELESQEARQPVKVKFD